MHAKFTSLLDVCWTILQSKVHHGKIDILLKPIFRGSKVLQPMSIVFFDIGGQLSWLRDASQIVELFFQYKQWGVYTRIVRRNKACLGRYLYSVVISNQSAYCSLILNMPHFKSMLLGFLLSFCNLHRYIFMLAYISVCPISS